MPEFPMSQTTASVIIPSYNSARTIGQTLTHLLKQSAADRLLEIIVVDSSDDSETKTVLASFEGDKVQVVTSGIRVMPAKQRNIGAARAKGDVLCFIDSDAYPTASWLQQILAAHDRGVRVGGGSYLVPEFQRDKWVPLAQFYLEFNEYIARGVERNMKMLPTCNLFCERALFEQVGGIPEIRASEDTLFGIRVNKESPVTFLPEASVYHIFREHLQHALDNQALLGKYIYVYRRYLYDSRYLDPRFVKGTRPALALVKLARIAPRIAMAGPKHWGPFVRSSPLFFLGLWYWTKGFEQGSREYETLKGTLETAPATE
jgi:glycosyltransferase involved in cell wall biosynthesis